MYTVDKTIFVIMMLNKVMIVLLSTNHIKRRNNRNVTALQAAKC